MKAPSWKDQGYEAAIRRMAYMPPKGFRESKAYDAGWKEGWDLKNSMAARRRDDQWAAYRATR